MSGVLGPQLPLHDPQTGRDEWDESQGDECAAGLLAPIAQGLDVPVNSLARDLGVREWRLTILGEPVAKARPKLGTVPVGGGKVRAMAFTPKKTRQYEDIVRQRATQAWNRPLLADVAITLSVRFYRGVPKSWSKKARAAALAGDIQPTGKPDLDNLVKSVTDALNGVVMLDDALVVSTIASKHYALEPRVEAFLTWRPQA